MRRRRSRTGSVTRSPDDGELGPANSGHGDDRSVRAMAEAPAVLVATASGVTMLTINRPEVHNALSWAVLSELRAALASAKDDPATRVVVLTGAGEKAFCAGADLSGMAPR